VARIGVRRRLAVMGCSIALCVGLSGVVAAVSSGSAYADGPDGYYLAADSSGLNLDVAGGSIQPGAPIIQNWPFQEAEQGWFVTLGGWIENSNSYMCIATDGVPGHQLFQEPCLPQLDRFITWNVTVDAPGWNFCNPNFGLCIDVYGNSNSPGAPIDGWPYNGHYNQWFNPIWP
jgi:hypothetical protein